MTAILGNRTKGEIWGRFMRNSYTEEVYREAGLCEKARIYNQFTWE